MCKEILSSLLESENPIVSLRNHANWLEKNFYEEVKNFTSGYSLNQIVFGLPGFIRNDYDNWKFSVEYKTFDDKEFTLFAIDTMEKIKCIFKTEGDFPVVSVRLTGYKYRDIEKCKQCEQTKKELLEIGELLKKGYRIVEIK